jgi:2-oxoisovalerate dehydrogenase E2 component (dihydrolipoyl transacylase)
MGVHVIKMPDIGEGIAEVELVAWHVKEGDTVTEDMSIADVMTDKATIEIPSPVHGKVLKLGGAAGQVMAVGSDLIHIEVEGEGNLRAGAASAPPAAPEPAKTAPPAVEIPREAGGVKDASASAPALPDHDAIPELPIKRGQTPMVKQLSGPARAAGEKPIASPAVRRRAWDLGIELQFVHGSGPAGRIMQEDLDAYIARGASSTGGGRDMRYAQRDDEQQIPVIGLRRKIAQKMADSKRRIPHFSYVEEVDMTELEALRVRLNEQYGKQRGKLTVLPLMMRAVVLALRDFPQMNARFDDEAGVVTQHGAVHMGVATQTDAGLMVTVMRHAEARDLWDMAAEIARLANAAREGKATREELSGSTITVTSLGPLGGIVTTPVINHPEVAIIGPNKIVDRPVIRNGAMVARKMMNLSSSFDHRVVDGMHAAEFIQKIRALLECPAMLFIE